EGGVARRQAQRVGLEEHAARKLARRRLEHRVAEVGGEHARAPALLERERQVARSAADIEHAGLRAVENRAHARHCAPAPEAVEIAREQMVGEIVARRAAAEHAAHPPRRLLFGLGSPRRRALHTRALRMASPTSFESMPETTVTSPMRTGSTKWTFP